MDKLVIGFENCYGIKKLNHTFDFTQSKVQIIYAPNGSMKTSFAKTLEDIVLDDINLEHKRSRDKIFTEREYRRVVLVDNREIMPDEIFVINRMKDVNFKEVSTILVKEPLKTEFEELHTNLNTAKKSFIKVIQQYFGTKGTSGEQNIEQTIEQAFSTGIYTFIEEYASEINGIETPIYTHIVFKEIFNEKVNDFLKNESFNIKIIEYMNIYEKLVNENTTMFKKGEFNHNNAENIAKSLKDNSFFRAGHKVKIKDKEISNITSLETIIKEEMDKVLTNPELENKFKEIDKILKDNAKLIKFRSYIENNQELLEEFIDLYGFKKKLILNYIANHKNEFNVLAELYSEAKIRLNEISLEAQKQQSKWEQVVRIFKNRFTVPFEIEIENQEDVILNNKNAVLIFTFKDGPLEKDKKKLGGLEISKRLSTGEKRVYYLLDIIFQIETRKTINKDQLIIIDDIADSFDYKNKYAIIEYIKDIADDPRFKLIILTHNFDFYNTIKKRLDQKCKYHGNFNTIKSSDEIKLVPGETKDVFPKLRKCFSTCEQSFISCIPFVRNLIEYTIGTGDTDYLILTSLLHIKPHHNEKNIKCTKEHTIGEVLAIFNKVFNLNNTIIFPEIGNLPIVIGDTIENIKVYDLVIAVAANIRGENENVLDLKAKLCLSIAIRYKAEEFILGKIKNKNFHDHVYGKQTGEIIQQYKTEFKNKGKEIGIFERVNLMTAENIHLNSFMYEPLMDLSEDHLRTLYDDVTRLSLV